MLPLSFHAACFLSLALLSLFFFISLIFHAILLITLIADYITMLPLRHLLLLYLDTPLTHYAIIFIISPPLFMLSRRLRTLMIYAYYCFTPHDADADAAAAAAYDAFDFADSPFFSMIFMPLIDYFFCFLLIFIAATFHCYWFCRLLIIFVDCCHAHATAYFGLHRFIIPLPLDHSPPSTDGSARLLHYSPACP